jgi:hypothetical protein
MGSCTGGLLEIGTVGPRLMTRFHLDLDPPGLARLVLSVGGWRVAGGTSFEDGDRGFQV